jgi:hypothetical protein
VQTNGTEADRSFKDAVNDQLGISVATKIFLDNLLNSGLAVRRYSEGGATSPAEGHLRRRHCRNIWLLFTTRQL